MAVQYLSDLLSRLPPNNLPANIRIHIAYIKQTCSSGCHAEYHQHYSRAKHMTKGNRLLLSLSYCSKSFRLRIHAVPNKVAFCTTPIFSWTCNFSNHFSHFFVTEPSAPITSEPHLKIDPTNFSFQVLVFLYFLNFVFVTSNIYLTFIMSKFHKMVKCAWQD